MTDDQGSRTDGTEDGADATTAEPIDDTNDAGHGGLSRRHLLGGAAAGASALLVANTALGRAAAAATTAQRPRGLPRNPDNSDIDHVVVLMMENRSFDHFLGWLPKADGPRYRKQTFADADGVRHPIWHLDTFTGQGFSDPDHSYAGGRTELNGGACDGWLEAGNNDLYSIGYYLQDDLSFYGQAAPYWTACDRFFASTMSSTYPNRFYMHAAQTDRKSNTFTISTLPTIWDSLAAAGVDGRYYYTDLPVLALWGSAHAAISHPYADFIDACATGTLPAVSFVDPRFIDDGPANPENDDHPHADIRLGQALVSEVYRAITNSPQWGRTLLVITYDEWGGFFDHVVPDVAPDVDPTMAQRGFRIPTLLIGPRVRRNHVTHRTFDHTSILKFIEWRWGLPALTPRDAAATNLGEALFWLRPPDLTAPQWDVPDGSTLAPLTRSARTTLSAPAEAAGIDEHQAEWRGLAALATQHGFTIY